MHAPSSPLPRGKAYSIHGLLTPVVVVGTVYHMVIGFRGENPSAPRPRHMNINARNVSLLFVIFMVLLFMGYLFDVKVLVLLLMQ